MKVSERQPLYKAPGLSGAHYAVMIFLFFAARMFFLSSGRSSFSYWITMPYSITYEHGFIARAFIGSLVSVLTKHLTQTTFYFIITAAALVMIAFISVLLGKVIARAEPDHKNAVVAFVLLFVTAPVSLTYLLEAHFGRLETFLLIFTLAGLVALKLPGVRWAIPLLCFCALATHPGYMVTYMPGLAIPMLYEIYRNKNSKKSIAIFSLSCALMLGLFVYFQLFSRNALSFASAEEMGSALSPRTDMKIGTPMLYLEYFAPFPGWVTDYILPIVKNLALPVGGFLLLLSAPILLVFAIVWRTSIRLADNRFLKGIVLLCACAPLIFIVAAVFGIDWDRQWAPVINCQFIFLFYLVISKESCVLLSIEKIFAFFERHSMMFIAILVLSSMAVFSDNGMYWLPFFDKAVYDRYFENALTNFDYLLG